MSEDDSDDRESVGVCEECGEEHEKTDDEFSGRVVQGIADLMGAGLDRAVTRMHEQIEVAARALGLVRDVSDEALQRYILMATYESMMTHAAAARALLARKGLDDNLMQQRADMILSAGRVGVAEMIAEEEREHAQKVEGVEDDTEEDGN